MKYSGHRLRKKNLKNNLDRNKNKQNTVHETRKIQTYALHIILYRVK